ncbi:MULTISPECIES: transcriptional regulator FtsR [unclassified Sanguibacter]|uniref:transcriptional regulator FtsR n=1 Tax=unclassified Sanguibacter TaxID=2645534 RepID=UPI003FD82CC0
MTPRQLPQVSADAADEAPQLDLVRAWPPGAPTVATMRISDVLSALKPEFPALTHSKLRFLEEQGLVEPVRTPAGYRQYSQAHVERLRYALAQQRDAYLPLRVIKEQLAELDAGLSEVVAGPRAVPEGVVYAPLRAADRETAASLAADLDVDEGFVVDLVEAGIVRLDERGGMDAWARQIILHASALAAHGVEPRHLRVLRTAVDREVGLVEQVVAPSRAKVARSARARAEAAAVELGESFTQLHAAMLRQSVSRLDLG